MASNRSHQCFVLVRVILIIGSLCSSSQAYTFYVGGKDGWVLKPSEDYNQWAQRNRFQVNDTLYFKYEKGCDSVLLVTQEDYNTCNIKNPMKTLDEGNSIFKFDRSGPFFFISGKADNCQRGQKLIVIVLAERTQPKPLPSSPPVASTPVASAPSSNSSTGGLPDQPGKNPSNPVAPALALSPRNLATTTLESGTASLASSIAIGLSLAFLF